MKEYNPLETPDPEAWLALSEADRIALVEAYHRKAGIDPPRPKLHAALHAVVETQIAEGDALPVRCKLERLMREGVDRHEALHAVASILAVHLNKIMRAPGPAPAEPLAPYFAELEKLTIKKWRRDFG